MNVHIDIEEKQARLIKCIGEPTRLRILKLLVNGDRSVGDIVAAANREQSLISHHLRALRDCNIVVSRKESQKIYYRLADPRLAELILNSESIVEELSICELQEPCHNDK